MATKRNPKAATAQNGPARLLGIPFDGNTGGLNAITDVDGVYVGHCNVSDDTNINTGVTAILPMKNDGKGKPGHGIDTFVFAGCFVINGTGEMTGTISIEESGFLEGPILLTNTVSVGTVRDAVINYSKQQYKTPIDPDQFGPYLPVVAETYDGWLNDILGFHVTPDMVNCAIDNATDDNVEQGNVGAGTGTTCYSWKGGIGTSSRIVDVCGAQHTGTTIGTYKVGVLVQANQGTYWDLVIRGVPVGADPTFPKPPVPRPDNPPKCTSAKSSIIVVIATDAPLLPSQLKRLARRATHGVARTGTITNDDSGEIFIAFSINNTDASDDDEIVSVQMIPNDSMDPLFEATVQATEEAIINALVAADTLHGSNKTHTAQAIAKNPDSQPLVSIMQKYNRWVAPPSNRGGKPPKKPRGGR